MRRGRPEGMVAGVVPWLACVVGVGLAGCGDDGCPEAPGVICTVVGTGTKGLSPDGHHPLDTDLDLPMNTEVGPDGLLYILDWNNHRVRVVDEEGVVRTVVGTGQIGDAPDGPALETSLNHPTHVVFEADGSMIISAWHNSKVLRYDPSTETVRSICGTGQRDFNGDGLSGTETHLDLPTATVVAPDGSLLISDQANQRLRRLSRDDVVETVVGTGEAGYSGDGGPATEAQIHLPVSQSAPPAGGIAIDAAGVLYIADSLNHVVRRVDRDGVITTVAGTGEPGTGAGGDPVASALHTPRDVAVDTEGFLYIADTDNNCVRRVSPDGQMDTVAGVCGEHGYEGDGGPATEALLFQPYGVNVGPHGALYVADTRNQVVRVVY